MERLTKQEMQEYTENVGLTFIQKQILQLKYFDERDLSVVQICYMLHISESKYYREQRKLLIAIDRYENKK